MRACDGFNNAAGLLPPDIRQIVLGLPPELRRCAEELRLRAGRAPGLVTASGERTLPCRVVSPRDLDTVLETATRASAHTALAGVSSGFVTVKGGCRVGLCGEAALQDGRVKTLRRLSSVSIRIPHEAQGCADELFRKLEAEGFPDTLIVSPPGAGKTTLLRELVRLSSDSGRRVSLIDERGEVAGVWDGEPVFDVGSRTDVMTAAPKKAAASMLIRAMSPQILAMDEITSPEDIDAAEAAAGCGVRLLATCHAGSADELALRPLYRRLLKLGIFKRTISIRRSPSGREYVLEELCK